VRVVGGGGVRSRDGGVLRGVGVHAGPCLLDHRVEAVVGVRRVGDRARGAVGLQQAVFALDHVAVARFPLALVVARVGVAHSIVEGVGGVRLQITNGRTGLMIKRFKQPYPVGYKTYQFQILYD